MRKGKERRKKKNITLQTPQYSNKIQPIIINSNITIVLSVINNLKKT